MSERQFTVPELAEMVVDGVATLGEYSHAFRGHPVYAGGNTVGSVGDALLFTGEWERAKNGVVERRNFEAYMNRKGFSP